VSIEKLSKVCYYSGRMKQSKSALQAIDYLRKLTPQKRIRIALNLWQFAKGLKDTAAVYDRNNTNTTRTAA
jgi:hypothetical protein